MHDLILVFQESSFIRTPLKFQKTTQMGDKLRTIKTNKKNKIKWNDSKYYKGNKIRQRIYSERDRLTVQRMLIYYNAVFLLGHAVSSMQAI